MNNKRANRPLKEPLNKNKPKNEKEGASIPLNIKTILLLFILVVLGVILGTFVTESVSANGEGPSVLSQFVQRFEKELEEEQIPLEPLITNLKKNTPEDQQRVVKISLSLSVLGEDNAIEVEKKVPLIRDQLLAILNQETHESLFEENEAGGSQLKTTIQQRLKQVLGEDTIQEVFITDIISQ